MINCILTVFGLAIKYLVGFIATLVICSYLGLDLDNAVILMIVGAGALKGRTLLKEKMEDKKEGDQ